MKKTIIIIFLVIIILIIANYKNILKCFYKIEYSEYVEKYSQEYGIDPLLVYSIIKVESNFNVEAKSNRGAAGLMQLMENTAREVAVNQVIEFSNENELYNPEKNIKLGIIYYSSLKKKYKNDSVALAAYNAGIGNVNNWISQGIIKEDGSDIENIPFRETNMYVRKILRDYDIYKTLYLNTWFRWIFVIYYKWYSYERWILKGDNL